jgi:hypothetical protein
MTPEGWYSHEGRPTENQLSMNAGFSPPTLEEQAGSKTRGLQREFVVALTEENWKVTFQFSLCYRKGFRCPGLVVPGMRPTRS